MNLKQVTEAAKSRIEEAISELGLKVKTQIGIFDDQDATIELCHEGQDGKLYSMGLELFISLDCPKSLLKDKGEKVPFYVASFTTCIPGTYSQPPDADVSDLCSSTMRLEEVIPVLLGKYVEYELNDKYGREADAQPE